MNFYMLIVYYRNLIKMDSNKDIYKKLIEEAIKTREKKRHEEDIKQEKKEKWNIRNIK